MSRRGLRRENWFWARSRASLSKAPVFPTLNATRRNVAGWPGLAEIKRRGQGARESSPLSSGAPGLSSVRRTGDGPARLSPPSTLPSPPPPARIVPNPSIERLRPVSFALFLSHLLPLPLLDRPGPAASTWRMLRNASSDTRGEGPEFHGRRKGAERAWR